MGKYNYKKRKSTLAEYMKTHEIDSNVERQIVIDGLETDYTVTIDGDVYSYKRVGSKDRRKLKHIVMPNGYHAVNIMVGDKEKLIKVHRLVALHFIPNPMNKPQVNHKDGDKDHNYAGNLEWATEKENIVHAYNHGLINVRQGEEHHCAKITEETVIWICELLMLNLLTYEEISKITHASYTTVKKINQGIRWKHVSERYNLPIYKGAKEMVKMRNNGTYFADGKMVIIIN